MNGGNLKTGERIQGEMKAGMKTRKKSKEERRQHGGKGEWRQGRMEDRGSEGEGE